jgi:hypothetical protein
MTEARMLKEREKAAKQASRAVARKAAKRLKQALETRGKEEEA